MAEAAPATFIRREPMVLADDFSLPKKDFVLPPQYKDYVSHVLLPHGMIVDRVEKLAADIREDYPASTIMFLVVLKGGNEFASDLTRALRAQFACGGSSHIPFTVDFVRVKSYEGTASSGKVTITGIDTKVVRGRDIVLLEDIIDTGVTMTHLLPLLAEFGPKSVRVASLLEKRTPASSGFQAHYVGFSVPNSFVVGYGLDYNEAYRELTHICIINPEGIKHFEKHEALVGL